MHQNAKILTFSHAQLLSLVRVVCAQSHCLDKKVFNLLLQVAVCRVCHTSTKASPFRCGALPGKGTVMASVCWQLSCLALGAAASQASGKYMEYMEYVASGNATKALDQVPHRDQSRR